MPRPSTAVAVRPHASRLPRILLALALALTGGAAAAPAPAQALTATEAEAYLLTWINDARVDRGLVPLVRWYDLAVVAGRRATRMAETNTLSHSIAGSLGTSLSSFGVPWYRAGETIASTTSAWPKDAAWSLFKQWRASSAHWSLLMSDRFNYVGVGLAYRSSSRTTFGSVVLTESPDHSGARAWWVATSRSGDDLRFAWAGADRRLQTHTAGLRDFDVQLRIDGGEWRFIRDNTTSTSIVLADRARGHTYAVRVRATDRNGTLGAWTSAQKLSVP